MSGGGQRSIGKLVLIMAMVVVVGVLVARSYYRGTNSKVDPRILPARELYAGYDDYARSGNYFRIFNLLDSIEQIYIATPHYRESFETGVLNNNRSAALLTIALYQDSIPAFHNPWHGVTPDSLISLAEVYVNHAISTYIQWYARYGDKSIQQIQEMIESSFMEGFEGADAALKEKYMLNRISEIEKAILEQNRRLSVCYTNLGLIHRYQGSYKTAAEYYEKALSLWDRNLDAENNLNRLLNRPVKKRNIIQKLFPPNRDN